jgi:hypothetical protein
MNTSERGSGARLGLTLLAWALLSALLVAVIGRTPDRALFVAVVVGWAVIAGTATRLHQLLHAARSGALRKDDTGRRYRAAALMPGAVVVALVASAPAAVFAGRGEHSATVRALTASLAVVTAVLLVRAVFRRDLERVWAPREASLFSWLVVDGALLAALFSAPFGALVLAARLSAGAQTTSLALSRHFASSVVLYAALLGVAGFAKAMREKKGGLVVARSHTFHPPSSIAVGGAMAVIALFVLPRFVWPTDAATLVVVKGALGAFSALLFFTLGGLRAAGEEQH